MIDSNPSGAASSPNSNSIPPPPSRKRRGSEALAEMLYKLRTEHTSPGRQALAVGIGVFIGCLPTYGLHFAGCVLASRLFRVNSLLCYLASYINNPLTALPITFVEIQLGHLLLNGAWMELTMAELRHTRLLDLVAVLIVGSLTFAVVVAVLSALAVFVWLERTKLSPEVGGLIEEAARPYVAAGISHWEFARAKLRLDPLYLGVLRRGLLPDEGLVVDLGCGRAIMLALLAAAPKQHALGLWPPDWPEPPSRLTLVGVERADGALRAARIALYDLAEIKAGDLREASIPACRVVFLNDVLHYLSLADQERLLRRVAAALEPQGTLVIREADAAAGLRFWLTRGAERLRAIGRLSFNQRFAWRSHYGWLALLRETGFSAEATSCAAGTPFANELIVARRER